MKHFLFLVTALMTMTPPCHAQRNSSQANKPRVNRTESARRRLEEHPLLTGEVRPSVNNERQRIASRVLKALTAVALLLMSDGKTRRLPYGFH